MDGLKFMVRKGSAFASLAELLSMSCNAVAIFIYLVVAAFCMYGIDRYTPP